MAWFLSNGSPAMMKYTCHTDEGSPGRLHKEDALKSQLWTSPIREWREEHLGKRGQNVQRCRGTHDSMKGGRNHVHKQSWIGSDRPNHEGWTSS